MRAELENPTSHREAQIPVNPLERQRADSAAMPHRSKTLWIHPAADWLGRFGLVDAELFLAIRGEIVSGHPDRHVMRVRLGEHVAYLKREHRVRLRDRFRHWCEGFGWVSKSAREAKVLLQLESAQLPAPQVLAFGEDRQGRAFLLVDEVAGSIDLRRFLQDRPNPGEYRELAERMGRALADLHEAGMHHPDLYAKHFLLNPQTFAFTILDWQRARQKTSTVLESIRTLASLNATLSEELVPIKYRLRALWAYRRALRRSGLGLSSFSNLARRVERESLSLQTRPGVREQRQTQLPQHSQRLVWLEGEGLCVIPPLVEDFQNPMLRRMLNDPSCHAQWLLFTGGRFGKLETHSYHLSAARWWARLRRRAWRSIELRRSRLLFHLERHHIPAPQLLAFGQRAAWGKPATAFLIAEPVAGVQPLWEWYDGAEQPQRLHLLRDLGAFLARLHEADCLTDSIQAVVISEAESSSILAIADITRLVFIRKLSPRRKLCHLARLWREIRLRCRGTEGLRILMGYVGQTRLTDALKKLARSILREAK